MQQSDYLLREIEKISILLMGMLGKMVQRKKEGIEMNEEDYTSFNSELFSATNFDLDRLFETDSSEFGNFLKSENGFDEKNIEVLGDLIFAMAEITPGYQKKKLYKKSYEIYRFLDISYKTFSLERQSKMRSIEEMTGPIQA